MSAAGDGESRPGREVAHRLFAAEFDDATLSYAESDEERAPNYVVTPTGARVNRTFVVGTLTEVTSVNEEMVRARVVDPTGAFVVYAGQYQPDQLAFLERAEPPLFVAVTGKARTFEPEDGDRIYTSIRPESIASVDADTRDRWVVATAEQTLERIGLYAGAAELDVRGEDLTAALRENDVPERLATGIPLAQDHYGSTPDYLETLRSRAVQAVETVAEERDQVDALATAPDETTDGVAGFASLAATAGVSLSEPAVDSASTAGEEATADAAAAADEPGASGAAIGTASVDSEASSDGEQSEPAADTADEPGTIGETAESAASAGETDADQPADEGDANEPVDEADADEQTDEADASDELAAEPDVDEPTDEADPSEEPAHGVELEPSETDAVGETADDAHEPVETTGPDDGDELGDFDGGDFDGEMYEMDEEERREVEAEFGTEFTTGAEVDESAVDDEPEEPATGEPAVDDEPDEPATGEPAVDDETDEPTTDVEDDTGADADDGAEADAADDTDAEGDDTEDVDLQARVVETMGALDDGDGADRTELIDRVSDETGASTEDVESAIQDALMGGQCYEPDDETLKAI